MLCTDDTTFMSFPHHSGIHLDTWFHTVESDSVWTKRKVTFKRIRGLQHHWESWRRWLRAGSREKIVKTMIWRDFGGKILPPAQPPSEK